MTQETAEDISRGSRSAINSPSGLLLLSAVDPPSMELRGSIPRDPPDSPLVPPVDLKELSKTVV